MIVQRFPRATRPHFPTLSVTLSPLLDVANAGGFHLTWAGTAVLVEQAGTE